MKTLNEIMNKKTITEAMQPEHKDLIKKGRDYFKKKYGKGVKFRTVTGKNPVLQIQTLDGTKFNSEDVGKIKKTSVNNDTTQWLGINQIKMMIGESVLAEKRKVKNLGSRLVKQFEKRAAAELRAGTTIDINDRLPTVAIDFKNGDEYFFQGQEADELLDEVPDDINAEDYILAIAQNW